VKLRYREEGYLIVFMGWYLLFYLFYPWGEQIRYILPIFPLYLIFVAHGLITIWKEHICFKFNRKQIRLFFSVSILLSVIIFSWYPVQYVQEYDVFNSSSILDGPEIPEALNLFTFTKENIPLNKTLAFSYPGYLKLYADRSTPVHAIRGISSIDICDSEKIQFIGVDKEQENVIQVLNNNQNYTSIFKNNRFEMFKRISE